MRSAALTRKHIRVLEAIAAAQDDDRPATLAGVARRLPLRTDLVDPVVCDLSSHGLVTCHGEFPADDVHDHPGPELRVTAAGQRALSSVRASV